MEGKAPRAGYGAALRSREFRALFAGQAIVVAGGSVAAVALTVLVYRRTSSPFLSSLTFALGFLPYALGGMLSGLVERVGPRRLVLRSNAVSAALAGLMAWPRMPVPALLVLLFCLGTLASLAGGAFGGLTRRTVSEEAYVPARSLMKIAGQTAQIAGSPIGGALVVAVGTSGAILVDAAGYALSFVLVLVVLRHLSERPEPGSVPVPPGGVGVVGDSLRGARELLGRPEIGRPMLLGWLVPMFSVAPEGLAAPYVAAHHGSPALVGWWLTALPAGVIAGDVAGVRFLGPAFQRRLVAVIAAASFVPYLLFALHPPVEAALALLVLSGLGGMYSLGLDGRLRDATPERSFARMMAINSAGLMTLQGLGFTLAGALAELAGTGGAIAAAGVLGLAAVALVRLPSQAGTSGTVHNLPT